MAAAEEEEAGPRISSNGIALAVVFTSMSSFRAAPNVQRLTSPTVLGSLKILSSFGHVQAVASACSHWLKAPGTPVEMP